MEIAENETEFSTLKNYYMPLSPSSEDSNLGRLASSSSTYKNPLKRPNKNIDAFFEKPKKARKKVVSSTVGRARPNDGGISYITTNEDDERTASHLVKVEIFDLKKLRGIEPSEHWKYADVRVKYYAPSGDDKYYLSTRDVIYNITQRVAGKPDCRKFFVDYKK